MKPCNLFLTCSDSKEASKIAKHLLENRLIACAKQINIRESVYWWGGKITSDKEVLLVMQSQENLFEKTEAEVTKLHSYDIFVLEMVPVNKINKQAAQWLDESLKPV